MYAHTHAVRLSWFEFIHANVRADTRRRVAAACSHETFFQGRAFVTRDAYGLKNFAG